MPVATRDFGGNRRGYTPGVSWGTQADLKPVLDPTHLAVVRCPTGWQPPALPPDTFVAVVAGEHEVTVVGPESLFDDPGWGDDVQQIDRGWRRVTFPGPLPWELVGFLADVATRLAGAHIPFTSMSGFTTDHVLVRAAQADLAVAVLSGEAPPPQRPGTNP
jgi:hypothetical protein